MSTLYILKCIIENNINYEDKVLNIINNIEEVFDDGIVLYAISMKKYRLAIALLNKLISLKKDLNYVEDIKDTLLNIMSDMVNNDGDTTLHISVRNNLFKNTSELVKNCNDPISYINKKNNKGETALHIAVSNGNYDMAYYLIRNGADVNSLNNLNNSPLHIST